MHEKRTGMSIFCTKSGAYKEEGTSKDYIG